MFSFCIQIMVLTSHVVNECKFTVNLLAEVSQRYIHFRGFENRLEFGKKNHGLYMSIERTMLRFYLNK